MFVEGTVDMFAPSTLSYACSGKGQCLVPFLSDTRASGCVQRIEFGTTPKMSTYLVAFIVGDLRSLEYQDPDLGVTFAVWSIPDKVEDLAFALEVAPKVTKVLGDYLKIPYSSFMPKMDLVAIPEYVVVSSRLLLATLPPPPYACLRC